jgi:hypothetical protein
MFNRVGSRMTVLCCAIFCSPSWAQAPAQKEAVKATPPAAALKALLVHPLQISLDGPRAEQKLGVLGEYADGRRWDLSRDAKITSSAEAVAVVDKDGVVRPVGDGQATLTVSAGGKTATVAVKVSKTTLDVPVSFSREITPILIKAGCNQGACHGAQHGRGGFKQSLLGFDPIFDYAQIVQSAEGRRVVVSDPESSILLQKPTLRMEHGGGERFKVNSREYSFIKRWLEDGVPEPTAKDPEVTNLEIWPAHRIMVPGEQQQILVKATWKDVRHGPVRFAQRRGRRRFARRTRHRQGTRRDAHHGSFLRPGHGRADHVALCQARQLSRSANEQLRR